MLICRRGNRSPPIPIHELVRLCKNFESIHIRRWLINLAKTETECFFFPNTESGPFCTPWTPTVQYDENMWERRWYNIIVQLFNKHIILCTQKEILDEFKDANSPHSLLTWTIPIQFQSVDILPHVHRMSPHWRFFLTDLVVKLAHVIITPPMDWNCMEMDHRRSMWPFIVMWCYRTHPTFFREHDHNDEVSSDKANVLLTLISWKILSTEIRMFFVAQMLIQFEARTLSWTEAASMQLFFIKERCALSYIALASLSIQNTW